MKKLVLFFIIIISFIVSCLLSFDDKYKVFQINSPSEIFIDFNRNLIFDETKPFFIPNIFFIDQHRDYSNDKFLSMLSDDEKFFLEYKAKEYVNDILKNRFVKLHNNLIIINGEIYSNLLLKSGWFFDNSDLSKQNLINKVRSINLDNYYIYNLRSGKYHKLSCPIGRQSKKYKIVYKNSIMQYSNSCDLCFNKQLKAKKKNVVSIQININNTPKDKESLILDNVKVYFLELNHIYKPTSKCNTETCRDLIAEINNAKHSIDFAIYGINNQPEIIDAIKNAQKRGVKLRWVCDFDKKNNNYYPDTEILKKYVLNYNTDEKYEKNNRSAIMHNKFFVFDNKKVWTGSANITSTDLTGFNANYSILINSIDLADIYTQEFEQMYLGKFHKEKNKINKSEIKLSDNIYVLPLFSPKDNIIEYIKNEINKSSKYIYISIFFITHKELIQPLLDANQRGVDIKIINDATNARIPYSIHKILRKNGIKVKTENFAGKMHTKSIVIDDKITIIGSMNYTKSGNNYNDENVLIITSQEISKYIRDSFLYLWAKIPDKFLKIDPAAESYSSIGSCFDGIDNDFDGKIDNQDDGCIYKK